MGLKWIENCMGPPVNHADSIWGNGRSAKDGCQGSGKCIPHLLAARSGAPQTRSVRPGAAWLSNCLTLLKKLKTLPKRKPKPHNTRMMSAGSQDPGPSQPTAQRPHTPSGDSRPRTDTIEDVSTELSGVVPPTTQRSDVAKLNLPPDEAEGINKKLQVILCDTNDMPYEDALEAAVIAHMYVEVFYVPEETAIRHYSLDWVRKCRRNGDRPRQKVLDGIWRNFYSSDTKLMACRLLDTPPTTDQIKDELHKLTADPSDPTAIAEKMRGILSDNKHISFEEAFQAAFIVHKHVKEEIATQNGDCARQKKLDDIWGSKYSDTKLTACRYLGITPSTDQIEIQLTADPSKFPLPPDGPAAIAEKMHAILSFNRSMSFEEVFQAAVIAHASSKIRNFGEKHAIQTGLQFVTGAKRGDCPIQAFFDAVWANNEFIQNTKDIASKYLGITTPSRPQIVSSLFADPLKSDFLRFGGALAKKMHAVLSENKSMSFEKAFQTAILERAYEKYANSDDQKKSDKAVGKFNKAVKYLSTKMSAEGKTALDEGLLPEISTGNSASILPQVIRFLKMGVTTGDAILNKLNQSNKLERLEHSMKRLGNGVYNTVYAGTYRLPDGKVFRGVY